MPQTIQRKPEAPAVVRASALQDSIKVEQLTCSIGAELSNVSLAAAAVDDALLAEIRSLLTYGAHQRTPGLVVGGRQQVAQGREPGTHPSGGGRGFGPHPQERTGTAFPAHRSPYARLAADRAPGVAPADLGRGGGAAHPGR